MVDTFPRKYSLWRKPQSNTTDNVKTFIDVKCFYNFIEVQNFLFFCKGIQGLLWTDSWIAPLKIAIIEVFPCFFLRGKVHGKV
jgi:hypothetical protein